MLSNKRPRCDIESDENKKQKLVPTIATTITTTSTTMQLIPGFT